METQVVEHNPDFMEFAKKIKNKTGLDLLSYKQSQVRRRLTSLKDRKGFRTFAEFYNAIQTQGDLYKAFMDQLTINVTEFYRNPERWRVLREQVIPDLLHDKRKIKCWSAACSTGEEPYSLVLNLMERVGLQNIEIDATDLDPAVLEKANAGRYASLSIKELPPEQLKQYFDRDGSLYVLSDQIKKRVRFKRHNLLADPYEKGYDLIVCRNVTIYFTEEAKAKIYRNFAQSLRPGGYLFVGATEQIMNPEQYGLSSKSTFFYKRNYEG